MFTLEQLITHLPLAWNEETRGNDKSPRSTTGHMAAGQCIVSSLLVQRHFGGIIVRCEVGGDVYNRITHYFNDIGGVMIDTTRAQFSNQAPYRKFKKNPDVSTYVFNDTWYRVDLLERRVLELL